MAWRENYRLWMQFVNEYKNRGGTVTVGSDSGYIYNLYGFGYIQEMELLREAGFSPLEVIHAATQAGARTLGHEDQVGTVRVGRKADLVIVNGNPVENLKLLFGTGTLRLNDASGQVERVGGVVYTVKDGIIYDARKLRAEVARHGREAEGATEHPARSDEDRDRRRIPVTPMTITYLRTFALALLLARAGRSSARRRPTKPTSACKLAVHGRVGLATERVCARARRKSGAALPPIICRASTQPASRSGWSTGRRRSPTSTRSRSRSCRPKRSSTRRYSAPCSKSRSSTCATRLYEAPFNADTFFWTNFTPREGYATADEYRRYLGRLRDVPRYFDEQIANMRAGLARGFTVPKVSVTGRDRTIEPYLKADETNPLYLPFVTLPPSIPADEQERMRAEARSIIAERIVPAYSKLLDFIRNEYLVKARTTLAAEKQPDGKAYYQAMIEKFTTLDLTAEQIHQIGLSEVARIKGADADDDAEDRLQGHACPSS